MSPELSDEERQHRDTLIAALRRDGRQRKAGSREAWNSRMVQSSTHLGIECREEAGEQKERLHRVGHVCVVYEAA